MPNVSQDKVMAIKLASLNDADCAWLLAQMNDERRTRLEKHLNVAKKFTSVHRDINLRTINEKNKALPAKKEVFSRSLSRWFNALDKDNGELSSHAVGRIKALELEVVNNG